MTPVTEYWGKKKDQHIFTQELLLRPNHVIGGKTSQACCGEFYLSLNELQRVDEAIKLNFGKGEKLEFRKYLLS